MNVAIITARSGSQTIPDKSSYPVGGKPLIEYPIQAALDSNVEKVVVTTDGENLAQIAHDMGCWVIKRPEELSGSWVNHGDVIKHAVEGVDHLLRGYVENVVLLLGNTVMVDGALINEALDMLDDQKNLDSVMSVWEAADDHPLRALEVNRDGLLEPYGDKNRQVSTNRQSYPTAYFYDQGVWVFRKRCVKYHGGPNPWWWMGERCAPIVRPWVTGRDIHDHFDVEMANWWLGRNVYAE